jgi:type I restriction enzyme S subunit
MSEWIRCCLKDIAKVQTGPFGSQLKNEQYITGGIPVVTVEHINNFRISDFNYPSVTNEDRDRLSKYLLNEGDIVFTRVGSVDLSAYVKKSQHGWMFSSRMLRVRPNNEVDSRFLSYFFQQKRFRDFILNIAVGATMPSINTEILQSIPVSFPPLPEQKAIASVLSSLDDKIDLLHRQNKTLETMAETLFRQWFVVEVEADESWERGKLDMLIDIDTGFAFKSNLYQNIGNIKVVRGKNVTIGNIRWGDDSRYWNHSIDSLSKYLLKHWDIVIGMDGSRVGKNRSLVLDKDLPSILAQRVARLRAKDINQQPFIWQHIYSNGFQNYVEAINTGTSIPHISLQQIKEYEISIPSKKKIDEFSSIVKTFWEKSGRNSNLIIKLESIRDTLLPKLMSGEVRINHE